MECKCHFLGDKSTSPDKWIVGQIELLPTDRVVVFSPSVNVYHKFSQCIIDLDYCSAVGALSEPEGQFLQVIVEPHDEMIGKSLFFKFDDQVSLYLFAEQALGALGTLSSSGDMRPKSPIPLTVIPDYKSFEAYQTSALLNGAPALSILSSDKPAVCFSGEHPMLLSSSMATEIKALLPLGYRFCDWRLVYSPKVHGISLPSFYRHFEHQPYPNIVIIADAKGCCVFGAFCTNPWDACRTKRQYFGTEECFVFSLRRSTVEQTHMYPSTCTNPLFQFCDDQRIVVGGGTTGSAIVVFDNWLRGLSHACETFGTTESLACASEFVLSDIEFWALIPDHANNDFSSPITS